MRKWIGILALLLAGCNRTIVQPSSDPQNTFSPEQVVITPKPTLAPRTLKLKLTLDQPSDLKVQAGEAIMVDQILSDRASKREQLQEQKQRLLIQLKQLQSPPVPSIRPESSHTVEVAQVQEAQAEINQIKAAIAKQEASSPWTQAARKELGIQDDKVVKLQSQLVQAQANYKLAVAKLQASGEKYREALYKDAATAAAKQPDTSTQKALLVTQLNEIDQKLIDVGVVRSPYGGTVKKIKWLGQTDQQLEVELTIAVAEPEGRAAL